MNIRGLVGFDPNTGLNQDFSFNELVFIPSIILEGSILTQGGALTGRLNFSPFKPNGQGTVFSGGSIATMPVTYSLFGLGLIYSI
jgi:hypothetical protein